MAQPLGPFFKRADVTVKLEASGGFSYQGEIEWQPGVRERLLKLTNDNRFEGRFRGIGLIDSFNRIKEADLRRARVSSVINDVAWVAMDKVTSRKLKSLIIRKLREHMLVDLKYATSVWLSDHADSSYIRGERWRMLGLPTKDELDSVLQSVLFVLSTWERCDEEWNITGFNFGIRGRYKTPIYPDVFNSDIVKVEGKEERDRIVMFNAFLSCWTLFLPDHRAFYQDVISSFIAEFLPPEFPEVVSPLTHGFEWVIKAQEALRSKNRVRCTDGNNWEAYVALILGPCFNYLMAFMNGYPLLPSGISLTSILGTICSLWVSARYGWFIGASLIIATGDDCNYVGGDSFVDIPEFVTETAFDTSVHYMLGVSFMNIESPVLVGLHICREVNKGYDLPVEKGQGVYTLHQERGYTTDADSLLLFYEEGIGDIIAYHKAGCPVDERADGYTKEIYSPRDYIEELASLKLHA